MTWVPYILVFVAGATFGAMAMAILQVNRVEREFYGDHYDYRDRDKP